MERESQQETCLEQIEQLRQKMVATARVFGIDHPKVLWYSQKIDEKHNIILKRKTLKC